MARLLFVLDIGFDRGGPSVHLLQDVIRAGLNEGHEIEVILKNTGGPKELMPREFANNSRFKYFTINEGDEKEYGFIKRYFNEIRYSRKCSIIFLKRKPYDAVFLQSNVVGYFYIRRLKRLKCRILFNVQDIFPYNLKLSGQLPFSCLSFPFFRKLQHLAYNKADQIITISEDMKNTLIEDGVRSDKIKVIYNWSYSDEVITRETIAEDDRFDLKMDPSKVNAVYAGNIGRMQNVELIVRAAQSAKEDPSIHFYIIGNGSNHNQVLEMVKGLSNVTIMPMQEARFAESIYEQGDVNIIPLVRGGIKTALPSKTATIMRTEKPIIFCVDKESRLSDLLKEDTMAVIADCDSPKELIASIRRVSQINHLGKGHREVFLQYFSKNNAREYILELTRRVKDK